jgi:Rps23 Pro-64 3,4-dihydroxylase Tpa1-like proline 4-hydroxylase
MVLQGCSIQYPDRPLCYQKEGRMLLPLNRDSLRSSYQGAKPFPFFAIENLMDPSLAIEASESYPNFDDASAQGKAFHTANERKKVQITRSELFPPAVARLHEQLSSRSFIEDLSYITGIPNLLADELLAGGGMHITGPGGRLDVHVDFNYLSERKLFRRVNLLLYLNRVWDEKWGGHLQLWDRDVSHCEASFSPCFNRCVVFETSDVSYHGVTPVSPDALFPRRSFAAYYYTREAPPCWKGEVPTTVFKARPEERLSKYITMPAERLRNKIDASVAKVKRGLKKAINRP